MNIIDVVVDVDFRWVERPAMLGEYPNGMAGPLARTEKVLQCRKKVNVPVNGGASASDIRYIAHWTEWQDVRTEGE